MTWSVNSVQSFKGQYWMNEHVNTTCKFFVSCWRHINVKKKLINFNFGTDCVNTFLSHEFEFVLQCWTQDFEILTGMYGILCVSYRSIFVSFYSSHSFSFFHIFYCFDLASLLYEEKNYYFSIMELLKKI